MESSDIRRKLHQYVDSGDDKLLKLMYVIAKEYNEEDDFEYAINESGIKLFEERRTARLNGESKIFGWSEAKDIITGEKKME